MPARFGALWAIGMIMVAFSPVRVRAADLKPATVEAWNEYVQSARSRNQQYLAPGHSFLWTDEVPGQAAKLRAGEVVVEPVGVRAPIKVPGGLIHDWIGAAFIPNVSVKDILLVLRDYSHYKDFYHPNVIESKPIASGDHYDQFSLLLMNRSVIAKTALDMDFKSSYARLDAQHWYGTSETTRIQEVADYGTASAHTLPDNEGLGLIWRLYSMTRLEERNGGVYIEIEAVALSRGIPVSVRWLVYPIVRRISRASLSTSLQQTAEAVRSSDVVASNPAGLMPNSKDSISLPHVAATAASFTPAR